MSRDSDAQQKSVYLDCTVKVRQRMPGDETFVLTTVCNEANRVGGTYRSATQSQNITRSAYPRLPARLANPLTANGHLRPLFNEIEREES